MDWNMKFLLMKVLIEKPFSWWKFMAVAIPVTVNLNWRRYYTPIIDKSTADSESTFSVSVYKHSAEYCHNSARVPIDCLSVRFIIPLIN